MSTGKRSQGGGEHQYLNTEASLTAVLVCRASSGRTWTWRHDGDSALTEQSNGMGFGVNRRGTSIKKSFQDCRDTHLRREDR